MEKTIISIIHEHSLDNNDFHDKETYNWEVKNLKSWINSYNPVGAWIKIKGWKGYSDIFDLNTQELIHFEP